MEKEGRQAHGCTDCGMFGCRNQTENKPPFCPGERMGDEAIEETVRLYASDSADGRMARAAAQIEGRHYCQKTRVEETVLFIQSIGAKKVGIATCAGLIDEARILAKILKKNGIDYVSVICKTGGVDKREMGLAEEDKIHQNQNESMCNPVLQAKILNREKTDLNIAVGLCVGHDALFSKYSDAPVTTLIAKDRLLGHNPVVALTNRYYRRLYE